MMQGMQDAICRAQMPAQAGPSCFQPQDQEDVQPCPGSMCHVDGATQTITGDFGQDVVESKHSLPLLDDTSTLGWMHLSACPDHVCSGAVSRPVTNMLCCDVFLHLLTSCDGCC